VEPNRVRWLIGGIFLLALAGYNFATYTVTSSQQSTFNIPSGSAEYLSKTEYPGNAVTGTFQETSGNLVSYYIMNSAQFASFQSGTSLSSVYSIENVASASVSYGFTTQDDYYFVFRHGTGLLNTTETVSYQRAYTSHDNFRLFLGILFSIFAAVEIVIGFRPRKAPMHVAPLLPLGQQIPPPFGATPQTLPRYCGNCGKLVEQSSTFCPSCGTKLSA
jgi:zinc-ribbon domain